MFEGANTPQIVFFLQDGSAKACYLLQCTLNILLIVSRSAPGGSSAKSGMSSVSGSSFSNSSLVSSKFLPIAPIMEPSAIVKP